ncbi:ABC transporter permease [Candidatus Neptunochlamydia vexilliferae]|uniref:Oligopeptide transport system permease protein OppC n=1 Tax=Candidatus Neptunichlamydia vexilliferae TaxID=1651774 RepID=A0ABS0AZS2_9BACT|nr:ABC transporter permease [Candidatus Neptunochlamydia vexilliferae]MBF5059107.1 Oligopeptide transport system permease protein OppC [Candidatus Neptunochlamydia vexilliferae]
MKESDTLISPSLPMADAIPEKGISYWKDAWIRLRANRAAIFGLVVLTTLLLAAIIVPFFTSHTYYETHLQLKNKAPCSKFWFGTDELGRDLFTRIWWGARISLFMGISAAVIDMAIGVFYGAFAGMAGGKTEEFMMRVTDILYSLPHLLIVILLMVIMKPGVLTIIIALTITGWINMARIVRAQILQIKQNDFVIAAHMLGAGRWRVLFRHLIPNALGSIITTMTLTIPAAIFMEAFLSFLGLGVQAPIASWGTMASDGLSALRYYPWRLFFPAGFISITMLSLNLLGDGVRDAFDPRLRR